MKNKYKYFTYFTVLYLTQPSYIRNICFEIKNEDTALPIVFYVPWTTVLMRKKYLSANDKYVIPWKDTTCPEWLLYYLSESHGWWMWQKWPGHNPIELLQFHNEKLMIVWKINLSINSQAHWIKIAFLNFKFNHVLYNWHWAI